MYLFKTLQTAIGPAPLASSKSRCGPYVKKRAHTWAQYLEMGPGFCTIASDMLPQRPGRTGSNAEYVRTIKYTLSCTITFSIKSEAIITWYSLGASQSRQLWMALSEAQNRNIIVFFFFLIKFAYLHYSQPLNIISKTSQIWEIIPLSDHRPTFSSWLIYSAEETTAALESA